MKCGSVVISFEHHAANFLLPADPQQPNVRNSCFNEKGVEWGQIGLDIGAAGCPRDVRQARGALPKHVSVIDCWPPQASWAVWHSVTLQSAAGS